MEARPVSSEAFPSDQLPTEVGKRFYTDYVAAYNAAPIGWAMYAYQTAIVALDAIKRAGRSAYIVMSFSSIACARRSPC